jgi:hypothetical protein
MCLVGDMVLGLFCVDEGLSRWSVTDEALLVISALDIVSARLGVLFVRDRPVELLEIVERHPPLACNRALLVQLDQVRDEAPPSL